MKGKPCDMYGDVLPCPKFGKCYGYAALAGKSGKAVPLDEIERCPHLDEVRAWWRRYPHKHQKYNQSEV